MGMCAGRGGRRIHSGKVRAQQGRVRAVGYLHERAKTRKAHVKTIIFNIHDVALILVMGECVMLATLLLIAEKGKQFSNLLLAGFLLLNACIAFDTLIYWSEIMNDMVSAISPNLFFLFGFSVFLAGPLLYFYTKSLIYKDFELKRSDIRHLLPVFIYPLYMYFIYYRYDRETKHAMVQNQSELFTQTPFEILIWLQKISIVFYGFLCLHQLLKYKMHLQHNYSSIEKIDLGWLKLLIGGFLTLWSWVLLTEVLTQIWPQLSATGISDSMGIIGNYLIFILINLLVFYSLTHSEVFEGILTRSSSRRPDLAETILPEQIEKLEKIMAEGKPYLEPEITLEQLAERLSLQPRLLSVIINRRFNKNFFEFINYYRVEQAKELLTSQRYQEHTMLDLMADAGFNSKSAFNRFFKKFVGMTPTEYRQKGTQSPSS
jgi:AraC-like DNA-binding protein